MNNILKVFLGLVLFYVAVSYWFPSLILGEALFSGLILLIVGGLLIIKDLKWQTILGCLLIFISLVQILASFGTSIPFFDVDLSAKILPVVVIFLAIALVASAWNNRGPRQGELPS